MRQIDERLYTSRLKEDDMRNIIQYGIACYKKTVKSWFVEKDMKRM